MFSSYFSSLILYRKVFILPTETFRNIFTYSPAISNIYAWIFILELLDCRYMRINFGLSLGSWSNCYECIFDNETSSNHNIEWSDHSNFVLILFLFLLISTQDQRKFDIFHFLHLIIQCTNTHTHTHTQTHTHTHTYCSAWPRLKLNTKIGLHTTHHPLSNFLTK